MEAIRILIADDEAIARQNLEYIMKKAGHLTKSVENGLQAISALKEKEYDLVLTDLKMQPVDGMELLEHIRENHPCVEVILLTGYATVATAVEAMKKGAFYYLSKPFKVDEVRMLVHQAAEKIRLLKEVRDLREQVDDTRRPPLLIGHGRQMEEIRKVIEQVAPTDCNVLISGETGTGKELIAKLIHFKSPRTNNRFLAINCGAFNEELLANELFGHEKEAFTGAKGVKKGLFEATEGGTILLDEIGEMPASMQVKLLRVLQERKLMRVGGTEEIDVNVRILAATNKDLKHEVSMGRFRQDLFFRLNVVQIDVPPLSMRRGDIPLLSHFFVKKFSDRMGKKVSGISDDAMDILTSYEFPGNVRELENIIERAIILSKTEEIGVESLPPDLQHASFSIKSRRKKEFLSLEDNEKAYIEWILKKTGGNKTKAAEILEIDRVSLWRKLKRYEME